MPAIIITPWRVDSIDPEGRVFRVRQLSFEKDGEYRNLHDGKPFEAEDSLEIRRIVRKWGRLRSVTLTVPSALLRAITIFLSEHHGKEHALDCYDFANLVAGIPPHDKSVLFAYREQRRRFVRRPGDTVFLIRKKEYQFRHAAIYLGHGLYISVYGRNGDLEVASLHDMKRNYGAKDVLTVVPRSRH
jgi:hypothetical protein